METQDQTVDLSRPYTVEQYNTIGTKLLQKLEVEDISTRSDGSGSLVYIEGWKVIQMANEIWGWGAWNNTIKETTKDLLVEGHDGKWTAVYSVVMRVEIKTTGTIHEDVGVGGGTAKQAKKAIDTAKKAAATDALKRTLRLYGIANELYDKEYGEHVKREKKKPKKAPVPPQKPALQTPAQPQAPVTTPVAPPVIAQVTPQAPVTPPVMSKAPTRPHLPPRTGPYPPVKLPQKL